MRVRFAGLIEERLPSGNVRWRVRKAGSPHSKITLHVTPEHPRFGEHYHAARAGIQLDPEPDAQASVKGSVGWLVDAYTAAMNAMQANGSLSPVTVQQRAQFLTWLRAEVGAFNANMPQAQLVLLRDKRASTPGAADNLIKAVRAMYAWGVERGLVKINPATGIKSINTGKGAKPWTLDDLTQYRKRHPHGTMAHLALTLFMFTAGRVGDVYRLGRSNEVRRGDVVWLDWQPEKRGSERVRIPMLPPLLSAIKAQTVIGPAYLMTEQGKPFASKNAFGNKFRQWVREADLEGLSPHGIRKAAGELLALHGASQYHIMSIHGHSQAKTSEVYTRGADRDRLAAQAMEKLSAMDW